MPSTTPFAATTNRSSSPSSGSAGNRGRRTPGIRSPTLVTIAIGRLQLDDPAIDGDAIGHGLRASMPAGSPGTGRRSARTGPCAPTRSWPSGGRRSRCRSRWHRWCARGGAPGARSVGYSDTSPRSMRRGRALRRGTRWPLGGRSGTPSTPPRMLPVPPGRMPSGTSVPDRTVAMARCVPSPPRPTTDATPRRTACLDVPSPRRRHCRA